MVMRLVGFWEYGNALANLDELLGQVTDLERDQLDDYVREREEYSIQTNLSRPLERGASSLASPVGDDDRRQGLDWVMALARVELGSMLAGFTDVPHPFEVVGPTEYDLAAYKSLLADGVRSHYWALLNDPQLGLVAQTPNIVVVMSYSRRLVIVRAMLRAVVKASRRELSQTQAQELASWKEALDGLQSQLVARIRKYLAVSEQVATKTTTKTAERIYSRYCAAILNAEKRELAAGTAKVIEYNP